MTNKFYSIVDFGSSKIRFSVFNSKLDEEYSQSVLLTNNYKENFENIKKFIKNGERKISNHIEEIILLLDSSNIFSIDITLKKKSDPKINLKKIYDLILMELDQLINLNYINFKIIHRIISKCKIDGIEYNEIPSNIKNVNNVIIDFKLICLPKKLIDNLIKEFNKNNLKIINIFCTSYVKAVNYMRKVVEDKIRTLEVSNQVSEVSKYPLIREKLVNIQQQYGKKENLVMDGRDIGTVVFTDAELKLFMTASPETRARRRYEELLQKGQEVTYDEVLKNVQERDYIDTHREDSPLTKADDAIEIDNSHLSIQEQFDKVLGLVNTVAKTL